MSESIKRRVANIKSGQDARELKPLFDAMLTDITALATAVDVLAAKLNADGGVTDTDYSVANAAAITTTS